MPVPHRPSRLTRRFFSCQVGGDRGAGGSIPSYLWAVSGKVSAVGPRENHTSRTRHDHGTGLPRQSMLARGWSASLPSHRVGHTGRRLTRAGQGQEARNPTPSPPGNATHAPRPFGSGPLDLWRLPPRSSVWVPAWGVCALGPPVLCYLGRVRHVRRVPPSPGVMGPSPGLLLRVPPSGCFWRVPVRGRTGVMHGGGRLAFPPHAVTVIPSRRGEFRPSHGREDHRAGRVTHEAVYLLPGRDAG